MSRRLGSFALVKSGSRAFPSFVDTAMLRVASSGVSPRLSPNKSSKLNIRGDATSGSILSAKDSTRGETCV